MLWLKGCPRCGGDLYDEQAVEGRLIACLQCGHILTTAQEEELARELIRAALGLREALKAKAATRMYPLGADLAEVA